MAFEILLEGLPQSRGSSPARPELRLSRFQQVRRDFAFVLESAVPAAALLSAVRGVDRNLVRDVEIFDLYEGPGVADGMKSIAVSVAFQPGSASMTESEIETLCGRIVAAVARQTGGTLRAE